VSKTILADVDGFTPVIDHMAEELGLMSAAVFGRAWRFCQMSDGVCRASLDKITEGLGIDRATVMRHLDKLCEAGYLVDMTPDLRNVPHTYADTGKASIIVNITVAQRNSLKSSVAECNATVAQRNKSVAESHLKRVLKTELNKEKEEEKAATPRADTIPEVALFHSVTKRYPARINFEDVRAAIGKVMHRLGREVQPGDLMPFYKAWCARNFNPGNLAWLEWAIAGKVPEQVKRGRAPVDEGERQSEAARKIQAFVEAQS
jgi:DNA-binding Lrp family transcriptional regulator